MFALTIICLLTFLHSAAQFDFRNSNYYDKPWILSFGLSGGGMNCLTDIGGTKGAGKAFIKDLNLNCTKPSASVYIGIVRNNRVGIWFEITRGTITGADSLIKNDISYAYGRYNRNLHFRTTITESRLLAEYYFLELRAPDKTILSGAHANQLYNAKRTTAITPYLLGGIGLFRFNPQAMIGNTWVFLHEFHTEGQGFKEYPSRKNYSLMQWNLSIGAGFKYRMSGRWNAKLEVAHRISFTDYLDDASAGYVDPVYFHNNLSPDKAIIASALADRRKTRNPLMPGNEIRGNPSRNDAYFTLTLKIEKTLNRK